MTTYKMLQRFEQKNNKATGKLQVHADNNDTSCWLAKTYSIG